MAEMSNNIHNSNSFNNSKSSSNGSNNNIRLLASKSSNKQQNVAFICGNSPVAFNVVKKVSQDERFTKIKLIFYGDKNVIFQGLNDSVEILEISEPSQLREHLQGINTLFLANNFLKEVSLKKELKVIDIARQTDVNHIVRLSSVCSDDMDINLSKLHRTVELYIVDSECFTYTFLRPNFLFQNIFSFNPNLFKDFSFSFPFHPESKVSFIDMHDVVDVIIASILNENSDHSDQVYTLTGQESLSMQRIAEILSEKFGREFKFIERSYDEAKERWKNIGLENEAIEQFIQLCELVNNDKCSNISDDMETSVDRLPKLFIQFLSNYDHILENSDDQNIDIHNNNNFAFFKNILQNNKNIALQSSSDSSDNEHNVDDDKKEESRHHRLLNDENVDNNIQKKNSERKQKELIIDISNNGSNDRHHQTFSSFQRNQLDDDDNNDNNNNEADYSKHSSEKYGNSTKRNGSLRNLPSAKPVWVPDSKATACMRCGTTFNLFKRRHHCRACGKIYDSKCCSFFVKLPTYPQPERVCVECFVSFHK